MKPGFTRTNSQHSIFILFLAGSFFKKPGVDRKHSRNLSVSSARLTWSTATVLPSWESVDSNVDRVDQVGVDSFSIPPTKTSSYVFAVNT